MRQLLEGRIPSQGQVDRIEVPAREALKGELIPQVNVTSNCAVPDRHKDERREDVNGQRDDLIERVEYERVSPRCDRPEGAVRAVSLSAPLRLG